MKINKEGFKIISISGVALAALWVLIYYMLGVEDKLWLIVILSALLLIFWFFIVSFFREPRRVHIHDNDLVFSPCDGRVVVTELVRDDESFDGKEILFRQIAGAVARRIVSYVKVDGVAEQNRAFGFIKFGSRIDILLPKDAKLLVEIGDKVVGTQTPIARIGGEDENDDLE